MVIFGNVCALAGLWLRLRWRATLDQERRAYVVGVVRQIAPGTRLDMDDQYANGHRVRVTLIRQPEPRDHAGTGR
ncbi:hypothetical protein [Embleya scabrispora]|nr:hypothetical protein [Embleya scabrispora]